MNDSEREPPGVPGWVKIFGVAVAVLVVIVIVVLLANGSEHGPGRHGAEGAAWSDAAWSALPPGVLAW